MDTYLMMLYVSLDQERALKKLFTDNGWKYRKPDLQQITDQIGPVMASNAVLIDAVNNDKTEIVASPVRPATRITSPVRPATRSQNSKIKSTASDVRSRRASKMSIKMERHALVKPVDIKEESIDIVNDDDLTEYMDFGDEDDDFIDDDKAAKKRTRTLLKSLDCDHVDTEQNIMSKLDGTQEDLDDTMHGCSHPCTSSAGHQLIPDNCTSTRDLAKHRVCTVLSGKDCTEDLSRNYSISDAPHLSDAWCLEQGHETLSVQSLKCKKPVKMKVHVDDCVDRSSSQYKCDDCNKVYSQRSSWIRHRKSHKPGVVRCGPCSMYFDSVDLLVSHNAKIHTSSFFCTICGVAMARKSSLRIHMMRAHPENCHAKFSCPHSLCRAVFDRRDLYDDHLNIHNGQRPHTCPHCNKSFPTRASLKRHENNHSSERKSVQCEDCGKTFQSPGALHNHKMSVHRHKRYRCEQCDKVFMYRSGYSKHLASHKNEKLGIKSGNSATVVRDLKPSVRETEKGGCGGYYKLQNIKENTLQACRIGIISDKLIGPCYGEYNLANKVDLIVAEKVESHAVKRINPAKTVTEPCVVEPPQASVMTGSTVQQLQVMTGQEVIHSTLSIPVQPSMLMVQELSDSTKSFHVQAPAFNGQEVTGSAMPHLQTPMLSEQEVAGSTIAQLQEVTGSTIPQLQIPMLSGQDVTGSAISQLHEVTGLPLTTVQLDSSGQFMWICRT